MLDETEVSKPSDEGCPDIEQTDKLSQPNDDNGLQNQENLEVKNDLPFFAVPTIIKFAT